MMTIRVNADLFNLAYGAVSKEETRYYLNGVFVEPHPERGALLVSTDGHRMICIHDETGDCTESAIVRLPRYALALCVPKRGKGLGLDRRVLEVDVKANSATILDERVKKDGSIERSDPLITAHRVIIEGTYPDWRKVTPKEPLEPAGLSGFNPKFMASLGAFGAALKPSHSATGMYFLKSAGVSEGSPIVVRFGGVHHVFAVLMPMRTDTTTTLPSFLTSKPVEAIAA